MLSARTAAAWLRLGSLVFAGLIFSTPAFSQFTSRAAPEPYVRNLGIFPDVPVAGSTTIYAISLGGGMFKGVDDGSDITWAPHAASLPTTRLFNIAFASESEFYIATEGYGVQKTTNGGTSFTGINGSGAGKLGCLRIRQVALNNGNVYAGTDCAYDSGLWRSSDGGANWTRLGVGVIPTGVRINTISINNPGTQFIVTTREHGVFRSSDSGTTFAPANTGLPASPLLSTPDMLGVQCGSTCATLYGNVHGHGVYKSTDGGLNWSDSSTGLPAGLRAMVSGMNRNTTTTPFSYYVAIDDEGVWETTDDGLSWHLWLSPLEQDVRFIRSVVRDASVPNKFYVTKFNGVSRSLDGGASWYTAPMGRGTYNAIAHDAATQGLAYGVSTTLLKIPNFSAPVPEPLNDGLQGLMTQGVVYPGQQPGLGPDVLWATTDHQGVFTSTDAGVTWAPRNNGLPETRNQQGRLTFHRTNPNIMYFGSSGSPGIGFYRTANGGLDWTEANTGLTGDARTIHRIIIDRVTPTTLYIATDAGAFKSTNSGDSWTQIYSATDNSLPLPVSQIFQSGTNALELYIANNHVKPDGTLLASSGILKSMDGGATWANKLNKRAQNLRLLNGDILFAGLADGPGQPAVMRSSDKGVTWVNASAGMTGYDIRTFGTANANGALLSASLENGFYTYNNLQQITFSAPNYNVAESAATATVTVTRTGTTTGTASVQYQTTPSGSATAGSDFTAVTGTLNFAAGQTSLTFTIPITNDTTIEGPETIGVRLFNPSSPLGNVGIGTVSGSNATVTISDNDSTYQFTQPTVNVSETGSNVSLTVTRTGSATTAGSVFWRTVNGTATSGLDFGLLGNMAARSGTLTWAIGDDAPKTINVAILNDTAIEGPETFIVELMSPTGGVVGSPGTAQVTIVSEDTGVAMVKSADSAPEGAGTFNVNVARLGPPTGAVSVNYNFNDGTAVNGTHFSGTPGTLNWADGDGDPKSIPVGIIDDGAVNLGPVRGFTVSISGAIGATIGAPSSTVVTIAENDSSVSFSSATALVTEGVPAVTLTLNRTGSTAGSSSVTYTAADGTALVGSDFGVKDDPTQPTGTVTFNPGETSKTFTVPIINDTTPEAAKTFTVNLSSPAGAVLGTITTATVTIQDDQAAVMFAQPSYTVAENGGNVVITVNRVGPFLTSGSVTWTTANGTAVSGTDFGVAGQTANRTGVLLFSSAVPKTITIPILNNNATGAAKTFTVTLGPPITTSLVIAGPTTITVTITDDDIPPETSVKFSAPKFVVVEGTGNATLTLQRTNLGPGFGLESTVKYSTVAGTALAASDYAAVTNGTVTWPAGDSTDKTINIGIVNNAIAEPAESFKVVLSAPNPGTKLDPPTEAMVVILDDDELFPLDGVIPAGFSQAAGATKSWHVGSDAGAYEGAYTLKSDEIDDNETAGLEMSGTFAAGNVSFRVRISSEPTFDTLQFFIDNELKATWSGTALAGWQMSPTFPVSADHHVLKWVYSKDGSVTSGSDNAQIDALVTPAFTPDP